MNFSNPKRSGLNDNHLFEFWPKSTLLSITFWDFVTVKTHLGQPLNVSKCIYLFWNESNYSFRPRGILSMHTFNSFFGLNRFAKFHHFHKIIIFSKNRKFGSFIFDIQNGHLGQPYCFVSSVPWLSGDSFRPTKAISKIKRHIF